MNKFKNTEYIIASVLGLIIMFVCISGIRLSQIFPLINSDSLFFQVLYQDLLVDGNTLKGWDLNTTFNLLPNAILYLISFLISKNPFINILLHGLLQYSLFFGVLFYFYRSFKLSIPSHWHVPGLLLLNLFFFDAILTEDYYYASLFVHPYHFGAFILFFWLAGLNLRYIHKPARKLAVWIIIIGALGSFSNRILIIMFILPWVLALTMAIIKKRLPVKQALKGIYINLGGAAAGIALYIIAKNLGIISFSATKLFSWSNVLPSLTALFQTYAKLLTQSVPMAILVSVFVLHFILNTIWVLQDVLGKSEKKRSFFHNNAISLWMQVSLVFTLFIFFAPAINGMFYGPASVRYNFFVLLLPLVNISLLAYNFGLGSQKTILLFRIATPVFILVFAGLTILHTTSHPIEEYYREKRDFYPKTAKAVDQLSTETTLKHGVGVFLSSKTPTLYSRKGVKIRQVYPDDISLYPLAVARSWYYPQTPHQDAPVFNFILYHDSMNMDHIETIFGNNITKVTLDGFTFLLVPEFTFKPSRRIVLLSDLE